MFAQFYPSGWCPKKNDWKWCFFLLYLNPCKRKKHATTSMWGCCEVTTIDSFVVSLQFAAQLPDLLLVCNYSATPIMQMNICNNFTTEITLQLVCEDLAASLPWVFGHGELMISLQQMSLQQMSYFATASQLVPNSLICISHLYVKFCLWWCHHDLAVTSLR